ncbi:MAG: hypothetical protein ABH885_04295 [Candidatus Omnitrophota bacterium]
MKISNMAVGVLIFCGLLLIIVGFTLNFKGVNFLTELVDSPASCFTLANTCFILAFIVHMFDRRTDNR